MVNHSALIIQRIYGIYSCEPHVFIKKEEWVLNYVKVKWWMFLFIHLRKKDGNHYFNILFKINGHSGAQAQKKKHRPVC